jgi:hypothetical protein
MTYGFFFCISIGLIVFQTCIIPVLPLLINFYDLMVPLIAYLCTTRSMRESLPIILIVGLIMDQLSGSPFMLHVTAYFWLYLSLRWITKVLQVGNRLRLPFIVSFGVLIENFIFMSNIALVEPGMRFPAVAARIAAVQFIWAFFTGPLFLVFFEQTHKGWNRWLSGIFVRRTT